MNDLPTIVENDPERIRQLLLCLDGLRYSAAIATSCFRRAYKKVRSFESLATSGAPTSEVIQVVADVWAIVDAIYRMGLLINRTPLLPKKTPEIRAFLSVTKPVEELRHYVQHINREIGPSPTFKLPLWGTISWVSALDPGLCFTIITGSKHLAQSAPSLVYDRLEAKYTHRFQRCAGKTSIDLEELMVRAQMTNDLICCWANTIKFNDGSVYDYNPPVTPIMSVMFRKTDGNKNSNQSN